MIECDKEGKPLKDRKAPFEQIEDPIPSFLDKKQEEVIPRINGDHADAMVNPEPEGNDTHVEKVSPVPDLRPSTPAGGPGRSPKKQQKLDAIPSNITIGGAPA